MNEFESHSSESEMLHSAREAFQKTQDAVKNQGMRFLDSERTMMVDELHKVESALHTAAEDLKGKNSTFADLVDQSAETADHAARFLEERDAQAMFNSANDYARAHPLFVIGGLFLTGVALSRFFRASSPEHQYRY